MTEQQRAVFGEFMPEGRYLIEGVDPSHPDGLALDVSRAAVGHHSPKGVGVVVELVKGGHVIMVIPHDDWKQMVKDAESGNTA